MEKSILREKVGGGQNSWKRPGDFLVMKIVIFSSYRYCD